MTYKDNDDRTAFELLNGDVRVWIEQGAIHMIAVDSRSPVELPEFMAKELAAALLKMADRLDE